MFNHSYKTLAIAALALSSTIAAAQIYPIEFNVAPAVTNVDLNTIFFVDIQARSTDGVIHNVSLAEILVKWNPSLYQPLDLGALDPWYVPQNGFNMVFPALPIGSDGAEIGVFGGTNPITPLNIAISPSGLSLVRLRFMSKSEVGSGTIDLPSSYGTSEFLVQYNDPNGVQTVFAQGLSGLNGGTVHVGQVPEPLSVVMLGLGVLALALRPRSRR